MPKSCVDQVLLSTASLVRRATQIPMFLSLQVELASGAPPTITQWMTFSDIHRQLQGDDALLWRPRCLLQCSSSDAHPRVSTCIVRSALCRSNPGRPTNSPSSELRAHQQTTREHRCTIPLSSTVMEGWHFVVSLRYRFKCCGPIAANRASEAIVWVKDQGPSSTKPGFYRSQT